ncbi:MAG: hypothetical protein EAZ24_13195 [Burkholderiales bacterium]|nr:MAG: hypothetical protein EAZ24_13195 [Burkholderiales bacterium]TAG79818.1 MAG: hypothetical protein EAZ21_09530 [Betaproteobacteria bacterium]
MTARKQSGSAEWLVLLLVATPAIAFVWFVALREYAWAGFPLAFGLVLYGFPIGERIARTFGSSQRTFLAVFTAWFLFLVIVGLTYFGWTQGLPFGDWTLPKPVPKNYSIKTTG